MEEIDSTDRKFGRISVLMLKIVSANSFQIDPLDRFFGVFYFRGIVHLNQKYHGKRRHEVQKRQSQQRIFWRQQTKEKTE